MSEAARADRATRPPRVLAIDALRGMTILAMILVNNPGDWGNVYPPLLHAAWHGWTPTDLVFPFFLFVVGVSIVLALGWRIEAGHARRALVRKVVLRALVLFGLGLFLSGYPFGLFGGRSFERLLDTWRIPGVLQRIAVCYALVSVLFLTARRRTLAWLTAAFLLGYWALVTLVPVPGVGAPNLDTKGDHLVGWLDRTLLGDHVWYYGKVYDPEGILSTVPALATTLFGVLAGLVLLSRRPPWEKATSLFVRGTLLVVAGHVWGWFLPLNKALWTSSYAVFTAGIATCALALCYWFFDLTRSGVSDRVARPLAIYGQNALTVFVGSGVLARTLGSVKVGDVSLQAQIYRTVFEPALPPAMASLAYAVAWVCGWYLVLWWMDRRGWVLKA